MGTPFQMARGASAKYGGGQVPGTFGDQEVNQLALREVPSCPARI